MSGAQATRADPVRVEDAAAIDLLREALSAGGYTAGGVMDALGADGPFTRDASEVPHLVRVLPEGAAISTLVKLFLFGLPVAADEAARALAPLPLDRAEGLGVVRADGEVEAAVDLVPTGELVLASDRFEGEGLPAHADHVYGPTPPGRALASLTVRRRVGRALDLGTGSGMQALLAARHAERVVGVDINARALRFAGFNARLNGVANAEFRQGDLFEPVEGERFDLLVCNPPYVLSPPETAAGYLFRDSGQRGDLFCEAIVRRAPEFLEEGGLAHVLVSWPHRSGEDWSAPLRPWVEGTGCDAFLVRYLSFTPLAHAAEWNRSLRSDPDAYGEALDRWTAWSDALGFERIGWGAVTLRRRAGANWLWAESPPGDRMEPAGGQLLRVAASLDLLASLRDDDDLLAEPIALVDEHVLERQFHFEEGRGVIDGAVLGLEGGFRFKLAVDAATLELLSQLDGERPLGEAVALAADASGRDAEGFARAALPAVRRLLALGFLARGGTGAA